MAVHVVQGRDPWWSSLAVNVLGGLFNDWQQREHNKKEAAYLGEIAKMYNDMQNGQNDTAPAPTPAQAQDTGQGLLNMNMAVPEGYNNNGWANAFHKTESPLLQFDLGTAGIAPTTAGNAAPAVPSNAWANALGNSGNSLAEFDANTAGLVPSTATAPVQQAQAQGTTRAPIVTPMDFYRAALELAGTKRFRMLNPDRVQAMLTPYMKLNEEARQEQLRNNLADDYMNATDGAGRIRTVTGGALRGIVPESMATTVFNQNKPTVSTVDTGGQIHFYNTDPMTGMPTNVGTIDRTLTPQEIATHAYNNAKLQADIDRYDADRRLEYYKADQNYSKYQGTFTDADGVTWVIYNNGRKEPLSNARGLSAQQKAALENNGKIMTNIQTRRSDLQKSRNAWILKGATADHPELKKIEEEEKRLNEWEQRILQENNNIINPNNTGQQKQTGQTIEQSVPPVGQTATNNRNSVNQTLPTGQTTPNNGNIITPMPPAVPPTAQDIPQNAVLVNEEGDFYTQADIDRMADARNMDRLTFTNTLMGQGYFYPSDFEASGGNFRLTDNTPRWVMPDGTKITYGQEKALIAKVERGDLPDIKNTEEFYRDLQNKGAIRIGKNLGTTNTVANAQAPFVNVLGNNDTNIANASANNSSFGDFFNIFGATPAYADENISSNNTTLAADTNTEAGIQNALEALNGQFGEQRWADWTSGLDLRGITNMLSRENMLEALPNNQSYPAPNTLYDAPFAPPVPQQFAPNSGTIPNAVPQSQNLNPEGMVLASNRRSKRRTKPKLTYSGYYSGDTRNGGQYSSIINRHAKNNNVDPDLIAAIIQQESGGNRSIVSNKGAGGLMQLMPKTARGLGLTDVFDPEQNIAGGTKYIAQMLKRYNGNIEKALWAYNAGPGNADKGRLPDETKKYIPSVMARYRRLKGIATNSSSTPKRTTRKRRAKSRRRR